MSAKKEHYATRLKRELAEAKGKIGALVLDPDGELATRTKFVVRFQSDLARVSWHGNRSGDQTTGGILSKLSDK